MAGARHRLADRLLLVTNLVVANGAAACFLVLFLQPGALAGPDHQPLASHGSSRVAWVPLHTPLAWLVLALAVGLLVWNFAWLVRRAPAAQASNWVVGDTPSGPVRIAREAVENGLQKAGEALPEVTRLRVQIDVRQPKGLLVTGQYHCAEGQDHLAASQRLRGALTDRLHEMVRPSDGARAEIQLEFQGFAGKLSKKAGDLPPPESPPFTGPKYPIDDDQGTA
jgi:hypothetical protein